MKWYEFVMLRRSDFHTFTYLCVLIWAPSPPSCVLSLSFIPSLSRRPTYMHTRVYTDTHALSFSLSLVFSLSRTHTHTHTHTYVHTHVLPHTNTYTHMYSKTLFQMVTLTVSRIQNYRSLLQNIVSFIGLFCKRDSQFQGAYWSSNCLSHTLSLSFSLSHTRISLPLSRFLSHTPTSLSLSRMHKRIQWRFFERTHPLSLKHTQSRTHSLSLPHTHAQISNHALSGAHAHTHTVSLSHTHFRSLSHTHTHTFTQTRSFELSYVLSLTHPPIIKDAPRAFEL